MCRSCGFSQGQTRVFWGSFVFTSLFITFILVFFLGYKAKNEFNENAVISECVVINHTVRTDDGYITVRHLEVNNATFTVVPASENKNINEIWDKLRTDYPINSTITCYYYKDKPDYFKLKLDDVFDWLWASLCFALASLATVFIVVMLELMLIPKFKIIMCKDRCRDRCGTCIHMEVGKADNVIVDKHAVSEVTEITVK